MATKTTKSQVSASSVKETVYVDVDDEITNIIDKVKASDKKIIALVLPKRATVLQSVVNMKLLKKAAQSVKKNVVLITSEAGLLPLAGAAGIHVARSLQSKPEIPPPPRLNNDDEAESMQFDGEEPQLDVLAPVGALAAAAAPQDDDTETIELDNIPLASPAENSTVKSVKKSKKLKIPNFEKFRLGFFLAALAVVLLVVGWFVAIVVMPKATIAIVTDTTSVVSSFDFVVDAALPELDVQQQKIPGVQKELKKTETEKTAATGEKDMGTKATGEVTLSVVCGPGSAVTVPSGTAVSTGGLNFITQETATLTTPNFGSGGCKFTDTVSVIAAQNGDQYNIGSGKSFTVAGNASVTGTNSSGFSGGTSKKVKVVSQKDIDDAVAKIKARVDAAVSNELKAQLEGSNLLALADTLKSTDPKITANPAVDAEADEFTVSWEASFTMLGIKREDLVEIIKHDIQEEVDLSKQSITDDGIDRAVLRINNQASPAEAYLNFRTSVTAGPEIDEDAIKEEIRGKKRGDVERYISSMPGVKDVIVEYSPFWVYSTPKSSKKITVTIEKPGN